MASQLQPNNYNSSDEIDLGQLLELIKKGFQNLGNFFLRIFIYLRNNILMLMGLAILGLGISFGLGQVIPKKLKTDIIVRPNFESKNYLYDVIDELANNLKTKNTEFFAAIDIDVQDLEGFMIEVKAIEDEKAQSDAGVLNEMKYLEVLENFKDESFVIDILRSELSEKSVVDYRITCTYKDQTSGPVIAKKLVAYINSNSYFEDLREANELNAKSRIEKNMQLIQQVDELVNNYSKALLAEKQKSGSGVVYMEKENTLNVPSLLRMKEGLLKEIEVKKFEITQQTGVLSILNFGRPQEINKSFFNQTYFLIPAILVGVFLLLSLIKYLNRKAKEIA